MDTHAKVAIAIGVVALVGVGLFLLSRQSGIAASQRHVPLPGQQDNCSDGTCPIQYVAHKAASSSLVRYKNKETRSLVYDNDDRLVKIVIERESLQLPSGA